MSSDCDCDCQSELEEVRALAEAAHRRIEQLEADEPSTSGGADSRDQAVLEALEPGQRVSASGLRKLYRTHTDVRSRQTLKSRIKTLTGRRDFEGDGPGQWIYRGDGR